LNMGSLDPSQNLLRCSYHILCRHGQLENTIPTAVLYWKT
jgi:hypothetical protein